MTPEQTTFLRELSTVMGTQSARSIHAYLAAQGGIVAIIQAVQAGKAANPSAAAESDRIAKILDLLYAEHEREGGEWPIPEHFGLAQYTTTVTLRVPSSTHWDYAFPGTDIPTEDQIDAALTEPHE